jgi:hypothetical protein
MSSTPFSSAFSTARASWRGVTELARSRSVRGIEVTAIASQAVRSSGWRPRQRCRTIPGRRREVLAVTSIPAPANTSKPHSAAALPWLKTARSPQARTAAIQRPCCEVHRCPAAYTPACTGWSAPAAIRRRIALTWKPAWRSWSRLTMPCCCSAIAAMVLPSGRHMVRISDRMQPASLMRRRMALKPAREVLGLCGKALDRWEKRVAEISDRCPKTQGPELPRLASVP